MSDPLADEEGLTGMLPNGAFAGDEDEDQGSGQGDEAVTSGIRIGGEPDPGPEPIEPGQD